MGGAGTEIVKFKTCWNRREAEVLETEELPHQGINELGIRIDKKIVVGAGTHLFFFHQVDFTGWDHRIRLWQWKNMKPLGVLKYHSEGVSSVVLSKIDNLLVSSGQDAKIALWNIF
jgi:WD40 repeat protein